MTSFFPIAARSAVVLVTPAEGPISLDEAKKHCKVYHDAEDETIARYLEAAVAKVSKLTDRILIKSTWDFYPGEFPCGEEILIPGGNLRSVTSVAYTEAGAGSPTTLVSTEYEVDTAFEPGRVVLAYNKSWPSSTLKRSNPIAIRFEAGWDPPSADTAVKGKFPSDLVGAILLLVGYWYRHREEGEAAAVSPRLSVTVENLCSPYRLRFFS